MAQRFLVASVLCMLAFGQCQADDLVMKELAKLDGTWTLIKMEISGKSLMAKDDKSKLIIKDGHVTSDSKDAPKESLDLSKVIDPSKKPKTITLPYEGKLTFFGIYEMKDNELRVCGDGVDIDHEKNPEARRPKAFDSEQGLLLVFKREKK